MYAWYTVQYSISVRYYSLHYYSNLLRAQVFDLTGKLNNINAQKKSVRFTSYAGVRFIQTNAIEIIHRFGGEGLRCTTGLSRRSRGKSQTFGSD